jgi:hypothetical protein
MCRESASDDWPGPLALYGVRLDGDRDSLRGRALSQALDATVAGLGNVGHLVQATVLPHATWLILLAMLLLALATRADGALTGEKQLPSDEARGSALPADVIG